MIVRNRLFVAGMTAAALLAAAGGVHAQNTSRQIQEGETLRGELTRQDLRQDDDTYYDVFRLSANAGERFVVDMRSDELDPYLYVKGPNGFSHSDDDSGGNLGAQITFTAPQPGDYEIWANSLEEETGAYSVSVRRLAAITTRPIQFGETLSGTLSASSPEHDDGTPYESYVFEGRAGQRVVIDMTSEAFDAYLVLRRLGDPDDLETDDDGGGGTQARLDHVLPSDGRYEIRANAIEQDAAGPFALALSALAGATASPAPRAEPIAFGEIKSGSLSTGDARAGDDSYYDLYRFRGEAGQRVVITMSSAAFDAYVGLYRAGETDSLASNDDGLSGTDSQLIFTIPASGDYDIRANSLSEGETGDYSLGLALVLARE